MAKNRNSHSDELGTILGHESLLEGKLTVKHCIRIDGHIKGDLDSTDTVTIGSQGVVEGNINAANVIIGGKVEGSIVASGKVTLEESSQLIGDLKTAKLVIEEGAVLDGVTKMGNFKAKNDKKGTVQE